MKNVTGPMSEALLRRAPVAAVRDGERLSRFVADSVERRVGRPPTQFEAIERSLAGPPMNLTDENGRAPTRDRISDD